MCVSVWSAPLFQTFFTPINNYQIILKMSAKINAGPHVKCLLFFSDLNQNQNVLKKFTNTPQYQIQ